MVATGTTTGTATAEVLPWPPMGATKWLLSVVEIISGSTSTGDESYGCSDEFTYGEVRLKTQHAVKAEELPRQEAISRPRWWRRAGVRAATEGAAGTSESISTAIEEAVDRAEHGCAHRCKSHLNYTRTQ